MTWLSFTIGFVLGLCPGVWFVWQWWSREDAEYAAEEVSRLDREQEESEREELANNEPPDHGPFRTAGGAPEEKQPTPKRKVLCIDCEHLKEKHGGAFYNVRDPLSVTGPLVCLKGPTKDLGPVLGSVRETRDPLTANANYDCPDFEDEDGDEE